VTEQSIGESHSTEPHGSTILKLSTFRRKQKKRKKKKIETMWFATDNARNNGHKDLPLYNTVGVNYTPVVIFIVRCIPMPKNTTGDHRRRSL